jgi:flagellar biosynthetic protein FlhB
MAEEQDKASKTEAPSQRRLDEARRKGEVAKSPEVAGFLALSAAVAVVLLGGGWLTRSIGSGLLPFIDHPQAFDLSGEGAVGVMRTALNAAAPVVMVLGAAAVAGVAGNLAQHGFLFTPSKLMPDPSKVSPAQGFKRLFGIDGLVNWAKGAAKLGVLCVLAYVLLKPKAAFLPQLAALAPGAILPVSAQLLQSLLIGVLVLTGVIAGADWLWQRHRFMARMRMSREELKEEHKDAEGDPHLKAKIKQTRISRARKRMIQNVPKATVVVTNPTHFAVALRYVAGETEAPVCVAKGLDTLALKIREVAAEAKVPIIEDPPLARALYAAMEVDDSIPREHYEAVAKIVGFVMGAAKGRPRPARAHY